ncbi:unnamed protein product [Acanthoscelides obtectus]|uniref:HTH La-type RNA-binding domain-containing protein n=1 Tax=Acanthoscelides obtectus TaxID=200917 RepID=A0A9P0M303_ACAOB|nr:unnamed protein product [Acanthoscelides obtectus]CAK1628211.1 La-related protein 1 [Acanthoscelides obtectus]
MAEREMDGHARPASAERRGRGGRSRGAGRPLSNRPANRFPSYPDYPNFPLEYHMASFSGSQDGQNFVVPCTETYHFNSNSYVSLDGPTLKKYIRNQIEYYFSDDNLNSDFFLRSKMDPEGYVPVSLIASFHRVRALTHHVALVVEAISYSDKLELTAGFKVRPKLDPLKWPILDKSTEKDDEINAKLVPPPPSPKILRERHVENLNLDVAEFIPHEIDGKKLNDNNTQDSAMEINNKENQNNNENTNDATTMMKRAAINEVSMGENKACRIDENNEKNKDDTNWMPVKRKNKGKRKQKTKSLEREELDFAFNEELYQDVPAGRQNTFSNDWLGHPV